MELSIKDIRDFLNSGNNDFAFKVGTNLFIRTVTMAHTGRLVEVNDKELVLEDVCWIADTGRFADFLKTGKLNECEPFPNGKVLIGRGGIIDCCEWKHALPRDQK
jgi:hypothetical protein